jgi:TatD DNase family protein
VIAPEEYVLFDAHNHLQDEWLLPHRAAVLSDLERTGVKKCVVNGTSEFDWPAVSALAQESSLVVPSFGLHPWDVGNRTPEWQTKLLHALNANPSAAIGEIGLDRWMLDRARPDDPRLEGLRRAPMPEQLDAFHWQLDLATQRNLPTSIHCLEAFGAMHDALRSRPLPARGFLLHAFSGSLEMAAAFVKLGGYFSFNGAFLDPRKERLQNVYAQLPLERLLVETDSPAMSVPSDRERFHLPHAATGQPVNHPDNLVVAYEGLAAIRNVSLKGLTQQIAENFARLFSAS